MSANTYLAPKVVLRKEGTAEYWSDLYGWTTARSEAFEFKNGPEAAQTARNLELKDACVAIFDPAMNRELVLPVSPA